MPQNEFLLMLTDQAHPVAALFGHVLASSFLLWIFSLVWESLLFKHVTEDPVTGKLCSIAAAWATAIGLRITLGFAVPGVIEDYDLPALLIMSGVAVWAGVRMREKIRLEDEQA